MSALAGLAIIAAAGLVFYGLGRAALGAARLSGQDAMRAEQAEAETASLKRQAEVMLEERTTADAQKRLGETGDF